jgi:hypothetical protein
MYKVILTSKQAIHQLLNRRMKAQEENGYLIDIIRQIRTNHPTMNCRAMYYKIQPLTLGRDKFEELCYQWGFMVQKPVNYHRTTNSNGVIRFENLMIDATITGINQAFVSDITYFELDRFYYITFILDAYTRCIIGHSVSDRLTTEKTTLAALQMAIKFRNNKIPSNVIFHSDGGGQYYDKDFLNLTRKYQFKNSMCEYAYQNGKAERINGVIKNQYLKHWRIQSYRQLIKEVDRAVSLYNSDKPHKELKYKTPLAVELEQIYLLELTSPHNQSVSLK